MGAEVSKTHLNPIAYDGVSQTDITPVLVENMEELKPILVSTVYTVPITGEITTEDGADGGRLYSVTINGQTYVYNPVTNTITVSGSPIEGTNTYTFNSVSHELVVNLGNISGARFTINMVTGAYVFEPPHYLTSSINSLINYVVIDSDGDMAAATINFIISLDSEQPLMARDDLIYTNQPAMPGNDIISIPSWALLANDTGGRGYAAITGVSNTSPSNEGTVELISASMVQFIEENDSAMDGTGVNYFDNPFTYTVTKGSSSDEGNVYLRRADTLTLVGGEENEILISGNGGTTLNGAGGNDILIGQGGNEIIFAGNGDDILAGGGGVNTLFGNEGNDTVTYIDAAIGVTVNLNQTTMQNTGVSTDTLTDIENLIGSNFNDNLTGTDEDNGLHGLAGNDVINGLNGNDILHGGRGNDTLNGGAGSDTFLWLNGDNIPIPSVDVIQDFNKAAVSALGDVLHLADLLSNEEANSNSLVNYLNFGYDSGTNVTTLKVNTEGTGDFSNPSQTILFNGVNLAQSPEGAPLVTQADIINSLLQNGNLVVDA